VPDIMHLVKIHVAPARVYQAISSAEGIRKWWTRDAALDATIGGIGEFGFNGRQFVIKAHVDELRGPTHVRWTMLAPPFDGTTITFDVRANGNDAMLAFAHRGFKSTDDIYAGATTRWGFYLVSLKRYLESGQGSPNPDDLDV
jgi:uncharacterized protein YndB with AHSA1/START domain